MRSHKSHLHTAGFLRSHKLGGYMPAILTSRELGNIMRTERKRQGLTQAELAGLCGVGITFLSQLENGKETAELGKTLTVLTTLGLDVFIERRG